MRLRLLNPWRAALLLLALLTAACAAAGPTPAPAPAGESALLATVYHAPT